MSIRKLKWTDVFGLTKELTKGIADFASERGWSPDRHIRVYGYPRGGTIVAGLLTGSHWNAKGVGVFRPCDNIEDADFIVDDIYDSGATAKKIEKELADLGKDIPIAFLIDKRNETRWMNAWIEFPWEVSATVDIESHITRVLEYLGEDPTRDGLLDTPRRVVKSWKEIYGGYNEDPKEILSTAFDNDGNYNEMVLLSGIEFHSMCEHHMLPFVGEAHVAYIPSEKGKVVGISKLARLVEAFAKRLQIQEKMTVDIATALEKNLATEGVAVVITAKHFCMKMRGVKNQTSSMTTSHLSGVFKKPEARAEFMSLIKGDRR